MMGQKEAVMKSDDTKGIVQSVSLWPCSCLSILHAIHTVFLHFYAWFPELLLLPHTCTTPLCQVLYKNYLTVHQ